MDRAVDIALVGAGIRGRHAYGPYALAHPEQARFVAVAEPDPARREAFARAHRIPADRRFAGWQELFARPQLAAGALICTPDHDHVAPALAALSAGYQVLLEKPIAPDIEGCLELARAAADSDSALAICHVLRFTRFFERLHAIVDAGELGDVISAEQRENIGFWHMAHSFVRGHWRARAVAAPMLLAKCCHDLDILAWNLGRRCRRVSSFGSLRELRPARAPAGAPARCTDGCPVEPDCPYSAIGIYLDYRPFARPLAFDRERPEVWPFNVLGEDVSRAGRLAALREGPWGRCVYRCDNDVVDNQVVTLELADGDEPPATAVLVMHGHSARERRTMRYDGTRATLRGVFADGGSEIVVERRVGGGRRRHELPAFDGLHGGGDRGVMRAFVAALRGAPPPGWGFTEALESHLVAFAAEEARLAGRVVDLDPLRARLPRADA